MNEETGAEGDDAGEACGPAMAFPPIYVLRTTARCPECGQALHVYTLGCAAYRDADDHRPTEVFHFLRLIESLPENVLALLAARCPGYEFDHDNNHHRPCLVNHCRCGAKLGDDHLFGEVGAAYQPDTPGGHAAIRPFLLAIDEAIPLVGSYAIGGDAYLDLDNAEPWSAAG
jgi:hypothetical protein